VEVSFEQGTASQSANAPLGSPPSDQGTGEAQIPGTPVAPNASPLTPVEQRTAKPVVNAEETIPNAPEPNVAPNTPQTAQDFKAARFAALMAAAQQNNSNSESSSSSESDVDDNTAANKAQVQRLSDWELFSMMSNWTNMVKAIPTMSLVSELKSWLADAVFRVPMLDYLKNFFFPQQAKKTRVRGENFDTVMTSIQAHSRVHDRMLFQDDIDRSKWSDGDWHAAMVSRMNRENEIDRNGLFIGQPMHERRKCMILFSLIQIFLRDMSPSRLDKGLPRLCLDPANEAELFEKFPHLRKILKSRQAEVRALCILSWDTFPSSGNQVTN
jgi:hypothetical protein